MDFVRLAAAAVVALVAAAFVIHTLFQIWRDLQSHRHSQEPATPAPDSPSAAVEALLTGRPARTHAAVEAMDNAVTHSRAGVDFYDRLAVVLQNSLLETPARLDLRFKLLEVLHFLRREEAFRHQLKQFLAHGGSDQDERWPAIAGMDASFALPSGAAPVPQFAAQPFSSSWNIAASPRRFHEGHDVHRASRCSEQLAEQYQRLVADADGLRRFQSAARNHLHRPTPLQWAERVGKIFRSTTLLLKREDLCSQDDVQTLCAFAQVYVAAELGRREVITASNDGGASALPVARAAAALGLQCRIYLDRRTDLAAEPAVRSLRAFGARVLPSPGSLFENSDSRRGAYAAWLEEPETTLFVCGIEGGPAVHQKMLMDFHGLIGLEIQTQCRAMGIADLSAVIASRTAGLSAFGLMGAYLHEPAVRRLMHHSPDARDAYQREHAWLRDSGLVEYRSIEDDIASEARIALARVEGIAVNTEDAGALAIALQLALKAEKPSTLVLLLSPQAGMAASNASQGSGGQTVTSLRRAPRVA